MSDSITKLEDMEPAQSYTGLGEWIMTTTNNMTKNTDVKPTLEKEQKIIFRNLLDDFREWQYSWKHYEENGNKGERPIDAEQYAELLTTQYEIEEL